MDLERNAVFVRVVEEGSFTAAARAIGVPKSTVSRLVSALEEELGVGLLRRTTRKLALTDAGRRYLEGARRALALLEETRAAVTRADREPEGHVRMTAPPDVPAPLLAEPLAAFARRHPRITVELLLTGRAVDLVAERVDLALRGGHIADSTLVVRRVGGDTLELYAAPSYLESHGRPKRVAELAQHDFVLFRAGAASRQRLTLTGPRGRASVDVRGSLGADSMQLIADLVESGAGVGLLPTATAYPLLRAHTIERVLPGHAVGGGILALVHAPVHQLPRRVALLRDFLWEEIRARMAVCTELSSGNSAKTRG